MTTRARIGVVRALKLGDLLCAVPALRALRYAHPAACITLIGLPWARDFVRRFSHLVDEFEEFPGYPGIPEVEFCPNRARAGLQHLQKKRFDLCIQMHGRGSYINEFVAFLGSRSSLGHYGPGDWAPKASSYRPYHDDEHEVVRWIRLMEHINIEARGVDLEFPLFDGDFFELNTIAARNGFLAHSPYVVLHPGGISARRWPLACFASVGRALAEKSGRILITGSPDERNLCNELAEAMSDVSPVNLSGQTSLGALGACVSAASLVVCNDTGVSHLAAALKIPSVVVHDDDEGKGWPPLDRTRHSFLSKSSGLTPERVRDAALHQLELGEGGRNYTL